MTSWAELLQNEINRVEKVLIERNRVAKEMGENRQGSFGDLAIKDAITNGLTAIKENDTNTIINIYRKLVTII